ncbi:hypothetical protein PT2222_10284 [Paraburkholderia tropica]
MSTLHSTAAAQRNAPHAIPGSGAVAVAARARTVACRTRETVRRGIASPDGTQEVEDTGSTR